MANCPAKDPTVRWQRLQRVQIELKLLRVSTRYKEIPAQREAVAALVRTEVQRVMTAQVGTSVENQSKAIMEFERAAGASPQALEAHLSTVEAKLLGAPESVSQVEGVLPKLALRISTLEERETGIERIPHIEAQLQTATPTMPRAAKVGKRGSSDA